MEVYQRLSDKVSAWGHASTWVLLALGVIDIAAFLVELRCEHKRTGRLHLTGKAWLEALGLVVLLGLGIVEHHRDSLQQELDAMTEARTQATGAELHELQARTTARRLNPTLSETITNILSRAAHSSDRIDIAWVSGDAESEALAKDLDSVFNTAGWNTTSGPTLYTESIGTGIVFFVHDKGHPPDALARVSKALAESGLANHFVTNETFPPDFFKITAGARPLAP